MDHRSGYGSSTYRVYTPADLKSIPPTAITKRSHSASGGVGWTAIAFLFFVGAMIGGGTYGAMRLVKPDAPVAAAPVTASTDLPVPDPLATSLAAATPSVDPSSAVPVVLTPPPGDPAATTPSVKVAKAEAKAEAKDTRAKTRRRPAKPARPADSTAGAASASAAPVPIAPPNPYEAL